MSANEQNSITKVGIVDPNKKNSPIIDDTSLENRGSEIKEKGYCYFNDKKYSPGAVVCSGGTKLVCLSAGNWKKDGSC